MFEVEVDVCTESGRAPFDGLLPPGVVTVACDPRNHYEGCYREEERFVSRAVPRRQREFIAGRLCAHVGLSRIGAPEGPILVGADRSPCWPMGYCGSISHCADFCAAAVASRKHYRSIGIDVEAGEDLNDSLISLVCTARERALLECIGSARGGAVAKDLFSIKESVFKCDYPIHHERYGFQHVEVRFGDRSGEYVAVVRGLRGGVRVVVGRFSRWNGHVCSSAVERV